MSRFIRSEATTEYPHRDQYINKTLSAELEAELLSGSSVAFMPNEWKESLPFEEYALWSIGVFKDGSRGCVHFSGIQLFMHIELPNDSTEQSFMQYVSRVVTAYRSMSWDSLYRCDKFQKYPSKWLKITFATTKNRSDALYRLRKEGNLNIASDDPKYYLLALRQHNINTAAWMTIDGYSRISPPKNGREDIRYLSVPIGRVGKYKPNNPPEYFNRDPTLLCSWDIETHFESPLGTAPRAIDSGWTIDIICLSFFWYHSTKPILEVCVTNHEIEPHSDREIECVIYAATQADMVRAVARLWNRMQPDILIAYNGSGFDTPLVVQLAKQHELFIELDSALSVFRSGGASALNNALQYHLSCKKHVKITADQTETLDTVMEFPGTIDIDVMIMMMKAHSKEEVPKRLGLNKYLELNGLSSKEDMPYQLMREIFRRAKAFRRAPAECHCHSRCELCDAHVAALDGVGDGCCRCVKWPALRKAMFDVAYYCKIDCLRPQELMVKRTVIADRREIANLSRTDIRSAIYQADGMRVQNLMGKYSAKMGIAFKNGKVDKTKADKEHNPGAFVPVPILGRHTMVPIFAVDATSLYPSLIMNGNISADMLVTDPDLARSLLVDGYDLRQFGPITYEKGEKKGAAGNIRLTRTGWFVRHGGDQDRLICAYDKRSADGVVERLWPREEQNDLNGPTRQERGGYCDCQGQCPGHPRGQMPRMPVAPKGQSYKPVYGREKLPNERMGLLPVICSKLFDKRIPVKKLYELYSNEAKEMMKAGEKTRVINGQEVTLQDAMFLASKYNAKQNAIKVLNNTVYGTSGFYMSPTYEFLVAATITGSGQRTIKLVMQEIERLGGKVWYGDTDSAYNSAPIGLFRAAYERYAEKLRQLDYDGPDDGTDWDFAEGWSRVAIRPEHVAVREELWHEMVRISMEYVPILCQRLCDLLIIENGTEKLKFAYEEVGMPFLLCGKKKYALIPHIDVEKINFRPPKRITPVGTGIGVMVRGLDMVKQGMTPVAKAMGLDFVYEALRPEDTEDLLDKVKRYVESFMKSDIDPTMVIKTSTYKPHKKNVAVLRFVERMRQRQAQYPKMSIEYGMYEPPEPGDKIKTVVVVNGTGYDAKGKIIESKIGDRMEYLHVFQASQQWATPYVLDKLYYLEKSVLSLLSRFVHYRAEFHPKDIDPHTDYSKYDDKVGKNAKKYLMTFAKQFITADDKSAGKEFKSIYRESSKELRLALIAQSGGIIDPKMFPTEDFAKEFPNRIIDKVWRPLSPERLAIACKKMMAGRPMQLLRYEYISPRGPMSLYRNSCINMSNTLYARMCAEAGRNIEILKRYNDYLDMISVKRREDPDAEIEFELGPEFLESVDSIYRMAYIVGVLRNNVQLINEIGKLVADPKPVVRPLALSTDVLRSFEGFY